MIRSEEVFQRPLQLWDEFHMLTGCSCIEGTQKLDPDTGTLRVARLVRDVTSKEQRRSDWIEWVRAERP